MQEWKPIIRHCRNCGAKTVGFKNKDGVIKVQCPKCGACVRGSTANDRDGSDIDRRLGSGVLLA